MTCFSQLDQYLTKDLAKPKKNLIQKPDYFPQCRSLFFGNTTSTELHRVILSKTVMLNINLFFKKDIEITNLLTNKCEIKKSIFEYF